MDTQDHSSDDYKKLLDKYNTLVKVCKIAMHDVRSPLRFFGDLAESLDLDKLQQPGSEEREKFELLIETSRSLYFFATNTLAWFIDNKLEMSMAKEKLVLTDLVKEIIEVYDKQIKANNNVLVTEFDENVCVSSNKEISSIIIRNALDNAHKYTRNGKITLKIKNEKEFAFISIEDNGKGFDHKRLLKNLSDSDPATAMHIGFRIIKDLSEAHGLTYELHSEKGVGTIFTLKYPLSE